MNEGFVVHIGLDEGYPWLIVRSCYEICCRTPQSLCCQFLMTPGVRMIKGGSPVLKSKKLKLLHNWSRWLHHNFTPVTPEGAESKLS